ncbi:MAG: NAD(P)H-dependent oxidoreductase [bacterium]|nr:NAD(P)H-dependent oxidoreductase [bacterium]
MPKILVFAGSTRRDSFNRKLAAVAAGMCRAAGAETTLLELDNYPLPLFSQDLEADEGLPANAVELKRRFQEHDGLVIACPEYNGSITPLLKNTIDWLSRRDGDEPPLVAYRGKTATLLSASPGALGGQRGLVHVRAILAGIGVLVLPAQVAVSRAFEAFAEDGSLADEAVAGRVRVAVGELVSVASKLHS